MDGVFPAIRPTTNSGRTWPSVFPGLKNNGGAAAFFILDTTTLTDGLHTIGWMVSRRRGSGRGIGSRFFRVQNVMSTRRAFFGALSALATSAATAEAQLRSPSPAKPTVLPDAELKLLRRITNGLTPEEVAIVYASATTATSTCS